MHIELNPDELEKAAMTNNPVARLLLQIGFNEPYEVIPISGGRNNRAFRIEGDSSSFFMKVYFQNTGDPRNRLKTEFSFASFLWNNGITDAPKPLAADKIEGIGLYEYVVGRRLNPGDIEKHHVLQAIEFFKKLNEHKLTSEALQLETGSEAYFSILEHLDCIESRIRRLQTIPIDDATSKSAMRFIERDLLKAWSVIKKNIIYRSFGSKSFRSHIEKGEQCLSPSDFGFHNALVMPSGRLRFFDFEYAGWDDPAKTVCDFFCQPQCPVPSIYFPVVLEQFLSMATDQEALQERIELLQPAYRIKWCCIMLNDFHSEGCRRRAFANSGTSTPYKEQQLKQSKMYFNHYVNRYL